MYSKGFSFFFLILVFSCNSSIENVDVNKLHTPCDCLSAKIEIYQKLNIFYKNDFDSIDNKNIMALDLDLVDDFSNVFKLIQKLEEINFKIQLNSWDLELQNCSNYATFQSINKEFTN